MSVISDKITSNGEAFTRADYNGVSILIRDKDGYINVARITDDKDKQKNLDKYFQSKTWKEIVNDFKNTFEPNILDPTDNDISYNINDNEHKGHNKEIYSTYVNSNLVLLVAKWCNISYAFKLSYIMNNVNTIKNISNTYGNEDLDNKIKSFAIRFITSYKKVLEQQINIPPIDEGDE